MFVLVVVVVRVAMVMVRLLIRHFSIFILHAAIIILCCPRHEGACQLRRRANIGAGALRAAGDGVAALLRATAVGVAVGCAVRTSILGVVKRLRTSGLCSRLPRSTR